MGSPPGLNDLPDSVRPRIATLVDAAFARTLDRVGDFEFERYRIAVPSAGLADVEPELRKLARAVVRCELRARLASAWPHRTFDGDHAEMIVDVRPSDDGARVWFEPMPAYVAGRYRKLARGISQTAFHCRPCRGRGRRRGAPCAVCGGTGLLAEESVEGFVRPPLEQALRSPTSAFHGSGREDVDVRMLGSGRPFVVSLQSPRSRTFDAADVAAQVVAASGGRVEVADLRLVERADMSRITTEHGGKRYRVVVRAMGDAALPDDAAERVVAMAGVVLAQRTPQRVARRADRVRERALRGIEVVESRADALIVHAATDPGLYVKEWVSGDEGRTTPSVSSELGVPCVCAELDVLDVEVGADSAGAAGSSI